MLFCSSREVNYFHCHSMQANLHVHHNRIPNNVTVPLQQDHGPGSSQHSTSLQVTQCYCCNVDFCHQSRQGSPFILSQVSSLKNKPTSHLNLLGFFSSSFLNEKQAHFCGVSNFHHFHWEEKMQWATSGKEHPLSNICSVLEMTCAAIR